MAITQKQAEAAKEDGSLVTAVRQNGHARESLIVQIRGVRGGYVSAWGRKEGEPDSASRNLGPMKLEDLFLPAQVSTPLAHARDRGSQVTRITVASVGRGSDLKGKEVIIFKGRDDHGASQLFTVPSSPNLEKELGKITPGALIECQGSMVNSGGIRRIEILGADGQREVLASIDLTR